ncbi:hypothetical protein ACVBE9_01230 [Eionea flava]
MTNIFSCYWILKRCLIIFSIAALLLLTAFSVHATDLPVKKSKSGICHEIGSTYYSRTKKYTASPSMQACLESGGLRPKR